MHKEMKATDVAEIYTNLEKNGIDAWIDGGWGIDALIGVQMRSHGDLDIVIQEKDIERIKELLSSYGYEVLKRDDLEYNYFHMADNNGHEVDITAVHFDDNGDGIFGEAKNNEMNPRDSFKGIGCINGQKVKCISTEYAIKFRLDHEIAKHDAEDVVALCNKFNIEVPQIYRK